MSRVEMIIAKVRRKAGSATRDEILEEMNEVQLELCDKFFAKKNNINLVLNAGQAEYNIIRVNTTDDQVFEGRTEVVGTSAVQLVLNTLEGDVYIRSRITNSGNVTIAGNSAVTNGGQNALLLTAGEFYPFRVSPLMMMFAIGSAAGQVLELIPASMCNVESVNVHKIVQVIRPETWTEDIEFTNDAKKWNDWKIDYAEGEQPLKGFVWDGTLYLTPVPSVETVMELLIYELPQADLEFEGDPELDKRWDVCLEWGVIGRLLDDENYRLKYEKRAQELSIGYLREGLTGPILVESKFEELGF